MEYGMSSSDSELEGRLTKLMINVGNQKGHTKRNLEQLVQVLLKDVTAQKPIFSKVLMSCIMELPLKCKIYSWLSALLNSGNAELVGSLIENVVSSMAERYTSGDLLSVKLCLRFLAELVIAHVLSPESFFLSMEKFIETASGLSSTWPMISDSIVFSVLTAIAWVAAEMNTVAPTLLAKFMHQMATYMQQRAEAPYGRDLVLRACSYIRDGSPEENMHSENKLESLWIRIQNFQSTGWQTQLLPTTPEEFTVGTVPKLGPLPSIQSVDRFFIHDIIYDTIVLTSHNHPECCQLLLSLPTFFNDLTPSLNYYDMIIESVAQLMLQLPNSGCKQAFYATLIVDLCKNAIDKVPGSLGRTIRCLFRMMDSGAGLAGGMDVECIRRLGAWFGHHLSNFDFKWKWDAWDAALEDVGSGKFIFMRETLFKCIRLSYYDRIKGTLPESFAQNPNVFPSTPPTYHCTYDVSPDEEMQALSSRVQRGLIAKYDLTAMEEVLEAVWTHRQKVYAAGAGGDAMEVDSLTKPAEHWSQDRIVRDVLVQNLLVVGSKSFSHCLNIIERNLKLLHAMTKNPEDKRHAASIVLNVWRDNAQFAEIVLDKFMNYRVLDPPSVISVIVSEEHGDLLLRRWFTWPILQNTLMKANRKCTQIKKKLEDIPSTGGDMNIDESPEREKFERALETALAERKEAYVSVFSKLCHLLEASAYQSERDRRFVSGIMRAIGREFSAEVKPLHITLEMTVFEGRQDPLIATVWQEIKAVSTAFS
ncbi:Nuclear cap-binding protein subunit 1 [Dinochytrium kinnereticum]|nr:Nuclear cap-binding protein subunit 1 [Dinochytrium kinnereticum]